LTSPLLNNNDITGAKSILLNITSGSKEITMDEVGIITDYVTRSVSKDALIIWGTGIDVNLEDRIGVTIIATGFESNNIPELHVVKKRDGMPEKFTLYEGNSVETEETHMEIKEKTNKDGIIQRTIEFDLADIHNDSNIPSIEDKLTEFEVKVNSQKTQEQIIANKKGFVRFKEVGYTSVDEKSNIDEIENTPAYIRKKVIIDKKEKSDNTISKFSLSTDEDNNIRLRQNNSYLFDNVD